MKLKSTNTINYLGEKMAQENVGYYVSGALYVPEGSYSMILHDSRDPTDSL